MFLYSLPSVVLTLKGQLKLLKIVPDDFLFATIRGAIRPVGRATGAQSGIAKLLAMLFPPSPFGPTLCVVQNCSMQFCIRYHPWRYPASGQSHWRSVGPAKASASFLFLLTIQFMQ
jgi:hypothetical protein